MAHKIAKSAADFAQDVDDDIASHVDKLSLADYGEWLQEFKEDINSRLNSRIEAWREDSKD